MDSIWLNVGEASADVYGALVCEYIREKAPEIECVGMGGREMRKAGMRCIVRSEDLSVMGITEVLSVLPRIWNMLVRIKEALKKEQPAAVFLFDCPDFNFRVARMAKRLGIPVYYCVAPQAWAWRKGRVKFLRKYVDELLCIFPFEEQFFREHGVNARYIGHPLVQILPAQSAKCENRSVKKVAVLPGSRKMEIETLVPSFGETCRLLLKDSPDIQLNIVLAPGVSKQRLQSLWPADVPAEICAFQERHERIGKCSAALAASGTVTLECALLGVPAVVAYRVSAISYALGRMLVHIPYMSMANLILEKEIFPEFLQDGVRPEAMAEELKKRLEPGPLRQATLKELQVLREKLGEIQAVREIGRRALNSVH